MFWKFLKQFFQKISGTKFQNVSYWSGIPEISGLRKKIIPEFQIFGTFSIMEIENISGSFPYVNHNPEFRWKPYLRVMLPLIPCKLGPSGDISKGFHNYLGFIRHLPGFQVGSLSTMVQQTSQSAVFSCIYTQLWEEEHVTSHWGLSPVLAMSPSSF